jgi:hypothetical protein
MSATSDPGRLFTWEELRAAYREINEKSAAAGVPDNDLLVAIFKMDVLDAELEKLRRMTESRRRGRRPKHQVIRRQRHTMKRWGRQLWT